MQPLEALAATDWRDRGTAVRVLTASPTPGLVDRLVALVQARHHEFGEVNAALQLLSRTPAGVRGLLILLGDTNDEVRAHAALTLGLTASPEAIPGLRQSLQDKAPNVRSHAAESLGRLKAREAVPDLMRMAQDEEFFMAYPAIEALGTIGDPRATDVLAAQLQNPMLAEAAAVALAQTEDERAVDPLLSWLEGGGDAALGLCLLARFGDGVRTRVLTAISADQAQCALDGWEAALDLCPAGVVQAAEWLVDVDAPGHDASANQPSAVRLLVRLLDTLAWRAEATSALRRLGPVAVPTMLELFDTAGDDVRYTLLSLLGSTRDERVRPVVLRALRSKDVHAVVLALRSGLWHGHVEPVLETLGHAMALVRQTAVSVLLECDPAPFRAIVHERLQSASEFERESALRVLGAWEDLETGRLIGALQDPSAAVQRVAVEMLGRRAGQDVAACEAVAEVLRHGPDGLRATAARAMQDAPPHVARECLLVALEQRDVRIRIQACKALGRIGRPDDVARLLTLLDRGTPHERTALAEALGWLGGKEGVEALTRMTAAEERDVVMAALSALGQSGHADAVRPLLAAARHDDALVRRAALDALKQHASPAALDALAAVASGTP